ncbi:MAG: NlpC/P60 family protein [Bacteroidota bacterium]
MAQLDIPEFLLETPYNGTHYPGAKHTNGLKGGANCQQFAYELLRYFGKSIPNFRSSNLWEDTTYTKQVEEPFEPLDLLLWHKHLDSYGAHVGIYIGQQYVIHLAKHIGKPVIWNLEQFPLEDRYKYFIGAKRLTAKIKDE